MIPLPQEQLEDSNADQASFFSMNMAVQGLNASIHTPQGAYCSGGRRPGRGNGGRRPPDRGSGKVKKRGMSLEWRLPYRNILTLGF
jgi:hypothetical protein